MRKHIEDLNEEERQFLEAELGGAGQVMAYRQLLFQTRIALDIEETPELVPRPMLQHKLRQRLQPQHTFKSGFEHLIGAMLGLFSLQSPMRSAFAAASLIIVCWFGGKFNENIVEFGELASDTVTTQIMDTALALQELDSIQCFYTVCSTVMAVDSFMINGIRQRSVLLGKP